MKLKGYSMRGKILDKELMKSALMTVARLHASSILAEARLGKRLNKIFPNAFAEIIFVRSGKCFNWCTSGVNSAIAVANSLGLDSSKIPFLYEQFLKLTEAKVSFTILKCVISLNCCLIILL